MAEKTLKELNIIDDFLFGSLVTEAEKVFYGVNTNFCGARLDIVIENQENMIIYDIEPDKRVHAGNVKFFLTGRVFIVPGWIPRRWKEADVCITWHVRRTWVYYT
ncbi:MAG: hypothetical protein HFH14_07115 [Lachnospiraceae bacterium]|nr:hypothetical protein [Lachnospiraceae bacterium]